MPELPEVETVRRGLSRVMEGRRIAGVMVARRDLRIPLPEDFADRLGGRQVVEVGRRAKYLTIALEGGLVLLVHLGMSGRMLVDPPGRRGRNQPARALGRFAHVAGGLDRHEHVVFVLDDDTAIRFADPRRFGLMALVEPGGLAAHKLLAHLGPEPMAEGFDGTALERLLDDRRTSIKAALLDQRVVAGLGNIYVCESLFAARISPMRLAANVRGGRAARLARAVRETLAAAIEAGGSTLRDHVAPDGEIGYFQHSFKVYDREGEPCPGCTCSGAVRRIVQGGRSTFYCATRQR